jgi:hypothetical protein
MPARRLTFPRRPRPLRTSSAQDGPTLAAIFESPVQGPFRVAMASDTQTAGRPAQTERRRPMESSNLRITGEGVPDLIDGINGLLGLIDPALQLPEGTTGDDLLDWLGDRFALATNMLGGGSGQDYGQPPEPTSAVAAAVPILRRGGRQTRLAAGRAPVRRRPSADAIRATVARLLNRPANPAKA